jgi:hypothetical protein
MVVLTPCRKETVAHLQLAARESEAVLSLSLAGPFPLEGTPSADRPAASRSYTHPRTPTAIARRYRERKRPVDACSELTYVGVRPPPAVTPPAKDASLQERQGLCCPYIGCLRPLAMRTLPGPEQTNASYYSQATNLDLRKADSSTVLSVGGGLALNKPGSPRLWTLDSLPCGFFVWTGRRPALGRSLRIQTDG